MPIIPWVTWELRQAFPSQVSPLPHQAVRNKQAEVDLLASSDLVMEVVGREVVKIERFSQWRILVWRLENMESMSKEENSTVEGIWGYASGSGWKWTWRLGIIRLAFMVKASRTLSVPYITR